MKILTITGPTCSGKTTLLKALEQTGNFSQLTGFVTRPQREGEVHGKDYFFLSEEEAKNLIDAEEALEWVIYGGNYYGIPKSELTRVQAEGKHAVVILEPNGVAQFWDLFEDNVVSVFLSGEYTTLTRRFLQRFKEDNHANLDYYTMRLLKMYDELDEWATPAKMRRYDLIVPSCDEKTLPDLLVKIPQLLV